MEIDDYSRELCGGTHVRTTAEIVVGVARDESYARAPDPATGYRELVVKRDG